MKKVELKLWLYNEKDNFFNFRKIYEKANCFKNDEKAERKAMKAVSSLAGIQSISMSTDMNEMKLTVIGTVDPVAVVKKLRKSWHTDVLSVGEPDKKKEEPKKEDGKKEEPKKVEFKPIPYPVYSFPSAEEYPNASICAIL
ncbi:heavy metal-associated isoprenylated plant protein 39-like isoform X1 [Cornus florida]|uniref:heavy metal-associated isoprenylated plant protein 39-like isoform X1 n=1 Tax=Cornus florida TaxID=4283 RepID=UPI00289BC3BC|nr:heavy metal-associated isoprenylated plant protein 39-like isoform X1 [Cornus florida]